jgi:hypothetical protein
MNQKMGEAPDPERRENILRMVGFLSPFAGVFRFRENGVFGPPETERAKLIVGAPMRAVADAAFLDPARAA